MTRRVKLKDWQRRAPDASKRVAQRSRSQKPRAVSRAKAQYANLQTMNELRKKGLVAK